MGLTTIMSTTVMIGIVSELIPKTQYIPKLSKWCYYEISIKPALYVCLNLFYLLLATTVVICAPKLWQFISLMFTSCKNHKRGWFRRHFWFFRGIFTFICLLCFEWMVFSNLASFLGDTSILGMILTGLSWNQFVMPENKHLFGHSLFVSTSASFQSRMNPERKKLRFQFASSFNVLSSPPLLFSV